MHVYFRDCFDIHPTMQFIKFIHCSSTTVSTHCFSIRFNYNQLVATRVSFQGFALSNSVATALEMSAVFSSMNTHSKVSTRDAVQLYTVSGTKLYFFTMLYSSITTRLTIDLQQISATLRSLRTNDVSCSSPGGVDDILFFLEHPFPSLDQVPL